jgi:hypothetical protein
MDLPEDDPVTLAWLIRHLYTAEYPDMPEAQLKLQSSTLGIKDANTNLDLVGLAAELFAAGVKFGVKRDSVISLWSGPEPHVVMRAFERPCVEQRSLRRNGLEDLQYDTRVCASIKVHKPRRRSVESVLCG